MVPRLVEASLARLITESAMQPLHVEAVKCAVRAPFGPAEVIADPTMISRGVLVRERASRGRRDFFRNRAHVRFQSGEFMEFAVRAGARST
jgi:hypothetical protein